MGFDGARDPKTAEFTFFSSPYEAFTYIEHVQGCNTILNKFKRLLVIQIQATMELNYKMKERAIPRKPANIYLWWAGC